MSLPNWIFSKECEAELEDFLTEVDNQERNDKICKIFEQITLPDWVQNPSTSTTTQLNNTSNTPTIRDIDKVIIIDTDEEEITENSTISEQINLTISNLTEINQKDDEVLNENIHDFNKYIQETLETYKTELEDSDIVKLVSEFDDKSVIFLFTNLCKSLSDQALFSLNHSIVSCTKISTSNVGKLFCKYILLNKLKEGNSSKALNSLLKEFSDTYPEITRSDLLFPLFLHDAAFSKWQETLGNILEDNEKNLFLRDFVYSCKELEPWQIVTLQSMISTQTEDFVKRRLINLVNISSEKFTQEKLFLKFLITLIQSLGTGFEDLEECLHNVIEKNKTVLKIQARRALEHWSQVYNN